jgi:2-oxoglutarate dehydrogenase E2 component (dihydrolipoamide succinyltransferase)
MTITEVRVPKTLQPDIRAVIGRWFKRSGDAVSLDEPLFEIEAGIVTVEVRAPASGVLSEVRAKDGQFVEPGEVLGTITTY